MEEVTHELSSAVGICRECLKRGLAVVVVGFPATTVIYSRARLGRYPFVPAHLKSYVVCLSVYIIQILHLRGTHSSRLGVRCEGDRRGGGPAAAQVQPQLHRLRALRHPTLPYPTPILVLSSMAVLGNIVVTVKEK